MSHPNTCIPQAIAGKGYVEVKLYIHHLRVTPLSLLRERFDRGIISTPGSPQKATGHLYHCLKHLAAVSPLRAEPAVPFSAINTF